MTVTINAKTRASIEIDWREELIEDERNFYIKLSPDVTFEILNVDVPNTEIDKLTDVLQKTAKNTKVSK